jgi:hypothetical protein
MAVQIPILAVKPAANGDPPYFWCLPTWYPLVASWDSQYGKTFLTTACKNTEECSVPPEQLRQQVELALKQFPVWGDRTLTLDAYTIARNMQSEFGEGTPAERAAIGLAAVNRARAAGALSVTANYIHQTKHTYGKQGPGRPASTAQDPSVSNLLLGYLIASGAIRDFTGGATHYFDRVTQDFMNGRNPASNPAGEDLYLDWTGGGDFLTWLGHFPGIRPWRLALLKRRPDLKPTSDDAQALRTEKLKARAAIRDAGQKAVMGVSRAPAPWDSCIEAVSEAAQRVTGISGFELGDPALAALEDRQGIAVAGFCLFLAGVSGLAIGSMSGRRRRPALRGARGR